MGVFQAGLIHGLRIRVCCTGSIRGSDRNGKGEGLSCVCFSVPVFLFEMPHKGREGKGHKGGREEGRVTFQHKLALCLIQWIQALSKAFHNDSMFLHARQNNTKTAFLLPLSCLYVAV